MAIHNEQRPFQCSICAKAFHQPHHLKNHMNTHVRAEEKVRREEEKEEAEIGLLRDQLLSEMERRTCGGTDHI